MATIQSSVVKLQSCRVAKGPGKSKSEQGMEDSHPLYLHRARLDVIDSMEFESEDQQK